MYQPITATQLGIIRILLVGALAYTINELLLPIEPFPREFHLTVHQLSNLEWVHALAAMPQAVDWLQTAIFALMFIFAVGFFTRLAFVALVMALTVWTLVRLTHTGAHSWSVMLVALWAMLPVRWGDGFSLDARLGRARPDARHGMNYGWTIWAPGLVFGTAMWGAGVAKLLDAGTAWITNGTVKYHFVTDAGSAPTDWGLWVAAHHRVAVFLSAIGVFTELSLIVAVLLTSYLARLPFALAGLGLLIGFYVFQNEIWAAWWTLFLMFFIPWPHLLPRGRTPVSNERLLPIPLVVVTAVIVALQVIATAERVELSPLMSDYPMYSSTYASIEEFERSAGLRTTYKFQATFEDGSTTDASDHLGPQGEPLRDTYLGLTGQRQLPEAASKIPSAAIGQLSTRLGRPVVALHVLVDQRGFNWDTGQMEWRARDKPVWVFTRDGRSSPP